MGEGFTPQAYHRQTSRFPQGCWRRVGAPPRKATEAGPPRPKRQAPTVTVLGCLGRTAVPGEARLPQETPEAGLTGPQGTLCPSACRQTAVGSRKNPNV